MGPRHLARDRPRGILHCIGVSEMTLRPLHPEVHATTAEHLARVEASLDLALRLMANPPAAAFWPVSGDVDAYSWELGPDPDEADEPDPALDRRYEEQARIAASILEG